MHSSASRVLAVTAGLAALFTLSAGPAVAQPGTEVERPDRFTSAFSVEATPDEVPDPDDPTVRDQGNPGARATFELEINRDLEIVCYRITTSGIEPPFESPAPTATHIHRGAPGLVGPPVVAFPDPEGGSSSGCLERPFTDDGFSFADLEANPTGFYVDVHTGAFPGGDVRGQLGQPVPTGGVDAGAGGAGSSLTGAAPLTGGVLLALAALGGLALLRRREADATR